MSYIETMMRVLVVVSTVVAFGVSVAGSARGAEKLVNCESLAVGPGALVHGSKAGASCLLRAFQQCRPASYRLSRFGIDTIAVDQFSVVSYQGLCRISVTMTFRVVPQRPHAIGHGSCRTLARRASDIVASRCTGPGLPTSLSLTGRR